MIKKYLMKLKKKFYSKDLEQIADKTERFIILTNDFKTVMGAWYSILAVRIIPILLFIIPTNVVLARFNHFIQMNYLPDFFWYGPILMIMWAAAMAGLIVLSILAPKAATVFEYLFGVAYLFFVFRNHLFNTALGISLMIFMLLFLLIKTFFLVVKIIAKIKFASDGKDVERDESGRIVRAVDEDVFFVKNKEREAIDNNRPLATADNDFLFEKTSQEQPENDARITYDDDFFFDKINDTPEDGAKIAYDDDFFFDESSVGAKNEKNVPLAGSDDDFFFG